MRPRFAALAAGVAALILYGSLFPFEFHACAPAVLLSSSAIPSDRGDLLSNVLLYLPLGFFGYLALGRSKWSAVAVTLAGAALSFAIEMTQSCDYGRVPSLSDILANSAGTLAGSAAAIAWRGEASFAALALACWIGSRLLPYLPSTHIEKLRTAIRALFSSPRPLDVFHYFALWLAAAVFLDALIGSARSRSRLAVAIALVVAARIVIVDIAPASAELLGGACALLAWWWIPPVPARARIVAALFTVFVILTALEPF